MSNEQTMIQNNFIYTNINTNNNNSNSIKIKSFQSLPSPQLLQQTQSPPIPYQQYQQYQQYTNIDIKQPNINSDNGEFFSFPSTSLSMMDTINESEDKIIIHEYDPKISINSYNSPSPLSSMNSLSNVKSQSHSSQSGESEILSRDPEFPTDEHPSLHPKYTNETSRSSIITTSARSSANSFGIGLATNGTYTNNANANNLWLRDNLPKINGMGNKNKSQQDISSKLIYENMDKYQSSSANTQNISCLGLNEPFGMIEDDEDDIECLPFDEEEEDVYYPTETEFVSASDNDEYGLDSDDGALSPLSVMIQPPCLDVFDMDNNDSLLTTEQGQYHQETQYEIEYDEDGDHNTSIPVEFRKLQLTQSFNNGDIYTTSMSSPPSPPIAERIKHLNGNHLKMEFKRNHLSNIYSQHSDDEDIEYEMETVSSISNSKSMKKRNSTKKKKNTLTRRKYKKYSPPKHIQQKINIHKEIRRLSLSSSSIETERSNQNNNNKKRKLSISKSENNNISKPSLIEQTETKSFSFSFSSTHSHSQSSLEYIDHNYYNNNSATTCFEPSSIDSQVPPNRIRLSESACQHLVDLCEYQTGDDMD